MARLISKAVSAQASVLLVYAIFLFLIGLMQVSFGVALRLVYMLQLHIYCYPDWSGCLVNGLSSIINIFCSNFLFYFIKQTLLPFLTGVLYYIFKGRCLTVLISISSLLSFIGSVAFAGILIVETHMYDLVRIRINENKFNYTQTSNSNSQVFRQNAAINST